MRMPIKKITGKPLTLFIVAAQAQDVIDVVLAKRNLDNNGVPLNQEMGRVSHAIIKHRISDIAPRSILFSAMVVVASYSPL